MAKMLGIEIAQTLAEIFRIAIDVLIDPNRDIQVLLEEAKRKKEVRPQIRINVPQKNLAKFKEVLLYILHSVGFKPNIGETVIYKLLYFIDFDFYEMYETQLIGATYIKNKYGPTPCEFKKVVDKMIEAGEIRKVSGKYHGHAQKRYIALRKPDLSILGGHETKLIDKVLKELSDKTATQISEYSHGDVPWLTTPDGEVIEYESVFYRTPAYSVREYDEDTIHCGMRLSS